MTIFHNKERIPSRQGLFSQNERRIVTDPAGILPAVKESLAECVQRWQRESGLKPLEASQRAKKRGHKVSQDYIEDLASGAQVNPSPRIMKAVAAGFGKPVEEIVAAAMGWSAAEADQINGLIREIGEAYKQLSPAKQKDKRPLLEMINRELQREL